jgi:pimeloyl-ACP methyl ester carboxylesterase/DNA-binding CsgD family transcriptional regulator
VSQQIRFCRSFDGTRIAYALSGEGPPLVMAPHWFAHLELNWQNPVWRPWLEALSRDYALVRMDSRGCGLSDRDLSDLSFEALVRDLEAVVDAAGYEQFALYGGNQGGAMAIEYTARHPERVSRLVLFNAYARGWLRRGLPRTVEEDNEARLKLIELGWEREEPYYRQLFLSQHIAQGVSIEELRALSDLVRRTVPAKNLIALIHCMFRVDVTASAAAIRCPVLVLHAREAPRVPFEEGRVIAGLVPGARLVPLDTTNNILLQREPAFGQFFAELRSFLPTSKRAAAAARFAHLTARETEILERMAQGLDNSQIAAHLALSEKTVRNYISQIFDKLGVENRGQAIVLARDSGLGGAPPGG